jgi:hypothetical protein
MTSTSGSYIELATNREVRLVPHDPRIKINNLEDLSHARH